MNSYEAEEETESCRNMADTFCSAWTGPVVFVFPLLLITVMTHVWCIDQYNDVCREPTPLFHTMQPSVPILTNHNGTLLTLSPWQFFSCHVTPVQAKRERAANVEPPDFKVRQRWHQMSDWKTDLHFVQVSWESHLKSRFVTSELIYLFIHPLSSGQTDYHSGFYFFADTHTV